MRGEDEADFWQKTPAGCIILGGDCYGDQKRISDYSNYWNSFATMAKPVMLGYLYLSSIFRPQRTQLQGTMRVLTIYPHHLSFPLDAFVVRCLTGMKF